VDFCPLWCDGVQFHIYLPYFTSRYRGTHHRERLKHHTGLFLTLILSFTSCSWKPKKWRSDYGFLRCDAM
jgi:hypothetical protein